MSPHFSSIKRARRINTDCSLAGNAAINSLGKGNTESLVISLTRHIVVQSISSRGSIYDTYKLTLPLYVLYRTKFLNRLLPSS